jgi:hypothetical protein
MFSVKARAYLGLIEHWNGRAWSEQAVTPAFGGRNGTSLSQVSADRVTDAWAAGSYCASGCSSRSPVFRGFVLHWNGKNWQRSPLPLSSGTSFQIESLQALSPSDAWAMGQTFKANASSPVMLHWNGVRWRTVSLPIFAVNVMTFTSASNGWAIGPAQDLDHWNGRTWTQSTDPLPFYGGGLHGASADAASDVWAVGDRCVVSTCQGGPPPLTRDLILHYNGSRWSLS